MITLFNYHCVVCTLSIIARYMYRFIFSSNKGLAKVVESGDYDWGGVGDAPYYVLLHSILDTKYSNY